jgi:hypothetical protein
MNSALPRPLCTAHASGLSSPTPWTRLPARVGEYHRLIAVALPIADSPSVLQCAARAGTDHQIARASSSRSARRLCPVRLPQRLPIGRRRDRRSSRLVDADDKERSGPETPAPRICPGVGTRRAASTVARISSRAGAPCPTSARFLAAPCLSGFPLSARAGGREGDSVPCSYHTDTSMRHASWDGSPGRPYWSSRSARTTCGPDISGVGLRATSVEDS